MLIRALATAVLVALVAVAADAQTLVWDPNPEPDIAGYIVYRGEASRTYTLATDVGNVTSTPIPYPDPTKRYYFAVRAYNTSKLQSELSAEVMSTPVQSTPSPNQTCVPPNGSLVDAAANVWTLSGSLILRNGVQAGNGQGSKILYSAQNIYVIGTDGGWWQWSGSSWFSSNPANPACLTDPPPPVVTCTATLGEPTTLPSGLSVGDISIALTDPSCSWTASSSSSWLTLSASVGAGTQMIRFTAQANPTQAIRSATVVVQPAASGTAATMTITQDAAPPAPIDCYGQFKAEYFTNIDLAGAPGLTVCEAAIAHEWGAGGPNIGTADDFSARWTGTFQIGGAVTVTARTDDGMRVWLDDDLLIDSWIDQAATTYTADRNVTPGAHVIRAEFYERGGDAVAEVSWAQTPVSTCAFSVSQPITFARQGGSQTVSVSTQQGCQWAVVETVGWLSASPTAGTSSGTFRLTAQRYNGRGTRETAVTVGGVPILVRQQGR